MLKAKITGAPLFPIFEHALVHALLVFWLLVSNTGIVGISAICALIELVTHFAIDVLKGRLNVWFPQLMSTRTYGHWYVFGADQFLHILVLLFIAELSKG